MSNDFINRLRQLIEHYDLSPSLFADKIGVPRSSMSHLLSGRNKPSLDFVLKVITKFPEVNLYWLLNGKGTFPSQPEKNTSTLSKNSTSKETTVTKSDKKVNRVIIFYEDGTFESYNPNE